MSSDYLLCWVKRDIVKILATTSFRPCVAFSEIRNTVSATFLSWSFAQDAKIFWIQFLIIFMMVGLLVGWKETEIRNKQKFWREAYSGWRHVRYNSYFKPFSFSYSDKQISHFKLNLSIFISIPKISDIKLDTIHSSNHSHFHTQTCKYHISYWIYPFSFPYPKYQISVEHQVRYNSYFKLNSSIFIFILRHANISWTPTQTETFWNI